jgi:arylsulfatase A-like enzyme
MQGRSFRSILQGSTPADWRESMYYRYYMHGGEHNVYAHYGVRTRRFKLIYYYKDDPGPREWELFDLEKDPYEMRNVVNEPEYAEVVEQLKAELHRLRVLYEDDEDPWEGEPAFTE